MEVLTWIIIAVIFIVATICVYMWRYKTNKGSEKTGSTKNWHRYVGVALLCVVIIGVAFIGFLYLNNNIGISKSEIESDIRTSQKISAEWATEGMVSDTVAAFISYPQDKSDHTFSVYVTHPRLSFGYFFRDGDTIAIIDESIAEFTFEGFDERAFISMNTQNVERLEMVYRDEIQTININSEKPFAIVLPVNVESVTFYDTQGNIVEFEKDLYIS